jgi:hypothetical protein
MMNAIGNDMVAEARRAMRGQACVDIGAKLPSSAQD